MVFSSSLLAMTAGDAQHQGYIAHADDADIAKALRQESGNNQTVFDQMWAEAQAMKKAEQAIGYGAPSLGNFSMGGWGPASGVEGMSEMRVEHNRDSLLQRAKDEAAINYPTISEADFRAKANGLLMASNPYYRDVDFNTKTATIDALRAFVAKTTGTAMTDIVKGSPRPTTPYSGAGGAAGDGTIPAPPPALGPLGTGAGTGSTGNWTTTTGGIATPPPPTLGSSAGTGSTGNWTAPPPPKAPSLPKPPPPPNVVIEPNKDPNKTPHIYAPPPAPTLTQNPNYNIKNPGDKHR
jgi:hypothetical protein